VYHSEKGWQPEQATVKVLSQGPWCVSLERTVQLSQVSSLVQVIRLRCNSRLIEFDNRVSWKENRRLLKVHFSPLIRADSAAYECAFGMIERPTHRNTSWDAAKFECCGHGFVDVSEAGYGVSLMSDSKYGYSVEGSCMSMSLLRAPKAPDLHCDVKEEHHFRYAFYPHQGSPLEGRVVEAAACFQTPLIQVPHKRDAMGGPLVADYSADDSLFGISATSLLLDGMKLAEDGSGDVILRLYEGYGGRGVAHLKSPIFAMQRVSLCDGMENPIEELDIHRGVQYCPFQIISLRISFQVPVN
jgi:alpha-mannosidase